LIGINEKVAAISVRDVFVLYITFSTFC